ncbi:hypothetical protein K505DRAFT_378761, partial [Melanomma pulvis-pyrius CBS 109.77]
MVKAASFVLSIGKAVRVRWHESEDGCINFSVNYSTDSPGGIERSTAHDKSSWIYAERCRDEENTLTFEALISNAVGSNDSSTSTRVTKLRKKIEDSWEKTEQKLKNIPAWEEPANFFGISTFGTTEELSYRSLENSSNDLHLFQTPFHEVNLARFDKKRTEIAILSNPSFSIPNCRKSLLNTLHPGYGQLNQQERKNICKRYNAIITKGDALFLLGQDNVDLLLTLGSILSAKDLNFVSERLGHGVSISELLGEETIKNSRKYEERALRICNHLKWIRDALEEKQKKHPRATVPQKRRVPYGEDEQDDASQRSDPRTAARGMPHRQTFASRTSTHPRDGWDDEMDTAATITPAESAQCDNPEQRGALDRDNIECDGVGSMTNHNSSGMVLDGDLPSLCMADLRVADGRTLSELELFAAYY